MKEMTSNIATPVANAYHVAITSSHCIESSLKFQPPVQSNNQNIHVSREYKICSDEIVHTNHTTYVFLITTIDKY